MAEQDARQQSERLAKNAAPLMVLGAILFLVAGAGAVYGDGGPGVLVFGLTGIVLLSLGIAIKLRA